MSELNELIGRAYSARNGEPAWKRLDAIEAAKALAAAGFVILGGEVWCALGDGLWNGLIRGADGNSGAVWAWTCEPAQQQPTETWEEFCWRAATYTVGILETIEVEGWVAPELLPNLRYNLTYISSEPRL